MKRQQQEGIETLNTLTNGTLYNKMIYSKVALKTNEQQTSTQTLEEKKNETDADTTIKLKRFGENSQFFVDQRLGSIQNSR